MSKITDADVIAELQAGIRLLKQERYNLKVENGRLIGLWEKLKKWANDEDETDGLDIGDFIDQINYLANQATQ